jgi:hypothetical protein
VGAACPRRSRRRGAGDPGRRPTCRCWTRPGTGSATRRRPAGPSGTRPPSRPSTST